MARKISVSRGGSGVKVEAGVGADEAGGAVGLGARVGAGPPTILKSTVSTYERYLGSYDL